MVKTFYDPKVEDKAKAETLIMILKQKFGDLDSSYQTRIEKFEIKILGDL